MLVQFTLKNFLSFKERTTLDFAAINAYKEHQYHLIDNGTKEKLIRVTAIYGANASGKSNLACGMYSFQRIVAESMNNVSDHESSTISKCYMPFAFDNEDRNTEFEIVELLGEYEYRYGFEYNADYIVSEWMYRKSISTNRTSTILERNEEKIAFGPLARKFCDIYREQIPAETLALSFFQRLKLETDVFKTLYEGIMDTLVSESSQFENDNILKEYLPQVIEEDKTELLEFLQAIDTGIKDIECVEGDRDCNFYTTHTDIKGNIHRINLFNESEGTIKCICIYIFARVAIMTDSSLFVDELNVKLHPLLLKFIVDLFYNDRSRAQLIYTTHDTTLMDRKFFRRDQIWFVQKDEFGHSELTALSDFKVRSDASFEKDYLAGVYGGIPLIKEFEMGEGER